MIAWRAWSLLAGLPLGALAAWALRPESPRLAHLAAGALLAGVALSLGVAALARAGGAARERRLAGAAAMGFAAWPALAACALGLAPGPLVWLPALLAALALALWRGARARASEVARAWPFAAAALAVVVGSAVLVAAAVFAADLGARAPGFDEARARAIFDLDAAVATVPLPRCRAQPAGVEMLRTRGARPRFGPDGALWFDAPGPEGRRQIHRLAARAAQPTCWTCGEPGHNLRPHPGAASVFFETDRHATWWDPTNTELHWMAVHGARPQRASRRLTWSPGPDDHAVLAPRGRALAWSSGRGGRYSVVSASFVRGHGAFLLGEPAPVASGGARWIAPLAWSPDARSLVLVRGNPFRPLPARALDLALGESFALGDGVAPEGGADFNADGGWLALAAGRRARLAGLLPDGLGLLLAPLAAASARDDGALLRGTGVRTGAPRGEGRALALGEVAGWGEPTGVALAPDGREIVLGQRRSGEDGARVERLVRLRLDCERPRA